MTWRTAAATPFVLLGDDVAGAECAVAISTRWSFAMNQYLQEHGHTDSFITCSTQVVGEDVFIIFPNGDLTPLTPTVTQYDSVYGHFQVCTR